MQCKGHIVYSLTPHKYVRSTHTDVSEQHLSTFIYEQSGEAEFQLNTDVFDQENIRN